jgi:hypothetical protein
VSRVSVMWLGLGALVGGVMLVLSPVSAGATLRQTPMPGNLLFQDDFATYSHRWRTDESPKAAVAYRDDSLNMRVVSPGVSIWSVPDFDLNVASYSVEVTAEVRGGSPDSMFGLVLHYTNDDDFYALVVALDGTWLWLRYQDDEWVDLTPSGAAPFARVGEEPAVHLRVDVMGERVALWLDGEPVGDVMLDGAGTGRVFGLITRAGRGYVDVSFDDFVARAIVE